MNNSTQDALNAIRESLNMGRYDVNTVITIIVVFVVFLIVLSLIIRIGNKARTKKAAEAGYQNLIRKLDLTVREVDVITKLAGTLRYPEKKYLLLINKGTFYNAVSKLENLSEKEKVLVSSIKEKAGFHSGADFKDYLSTRSLTRGMPVYLETKSKDFLPSEIYSLSDSDIIIKILHSSIILKTDEMVTLYSFTFDGIKVYRLNVEKSKAGLISASHAEEEKPEKHSLKLEVKIKTEDHNHTKIIDSVLLLVEKGNAVLENPAGILKKGNDIRIFPVHDDKFIYHINAEIVKISSNQKLAMAKFAHVADRRIGV